MDRPQVARRAPLVKRLLMLDGIGRSGKFLAANLLNGIRDVEPVQLCGLLEHIPYYEKLGFMDRRAAQELLHHEIDMHAYEMLIGRNLNHRIFDKSSIYNVAGHEAYLERSKEEDTDKELGSFWERGAYSFFVVHETLPDMQLYFETFPEMKVVSLTRSPVDIIHSWYVRDSMERWAEDPKFFNIPVEGAKGVMPWYMWEQREVFETLSSADRTILIIETLVGRYHEAMASLDGATKEKIQFISYEDILEEPQSVIATLTSFLGKAVHPDMAQILTREKLPNPGYVAAGKGKKLDDLRAVASPDYFERMLRLEEAYAGAKTYGG